ncbi:Cj0814 family flagellar-dependent secreted protein [Campylobacter troglodytis]|uniref:Cj0814 family flagellar-dependent secreted protein n=1 Tax=Campylobacter troglodytis TaxID=654363 RepID=UPI0011583601|nr:hypothetical protein [Campylobacter troglodytis]TQR50026.1 hypothetical protein DMC01_12860 [Campylobacter troglodytis]
MINSINQTSYNIPAFKDINSNARIKEASETKNSAQNEIYEKLHSSTTFVPKHYASGIVDKDEYALFSSIDKQKTMDNVYKLFSQLTKDLQDKKGFTQEEIINTLPFAFDYDKKTLNVAKTYTLEEYQEKLIKNKKNDENIESMITFYDYDLHSDELNLKQSENIFQRYGVDIGSQFYTNEDGTISKSGIFYAFYDRVANSVLEGETTIRGKLEGLDRNLSDDELKDLRKFLDENKLGNGGIFLWVDFGDSLEYEKLLSSNISIEEFKQKYLEFKEKVEAKQERWHKESQDAL